MQIIIECDGCGATLRETITRSDTYDNVIVSVEPCQDCIHAEVEQVEQEYRSEIERLEKNVE